MAYKQVKTIDTTQIKEPVTCIKRTKLASIHIKEAKATTLTKGINFVTLETVKYLEINNCKKPKNTIKGA